MVVIYSFRQFPICTECQMKRIDKPIKDPKYKKLLDIPQKLYEESQFLRNIKEAYLRFDNLTANQVAAFKKVVKELKEKPKETVEPAETEKKEKKEKSTS